jgi:hypothetical protein
MQLCFTEAETLMLFGSIQRALFASCHGGAVQTCACDVPGSLDGANSCFFDVAVWRRIWAKEAAAGKSDAQLTPGITLEETEWALRAAKLSAFIEDARLMANNLLPGEHAMHALAQCGDRLVECGHSPADVHSVLSGGMKGEETDIASSSGSLSLQRLCMAWCAGQVLLLKSMSA